MSANSKRRKLLLILTSLMSNLFVSTLQATSGKQASKSLPKSLQMLTQLAHRVFIQLTKNKINLRSEVTSLQIDETREQTDQMIKRQYFDNNAKLLTPHNKAVAGKCYI